MSARMLPKKTPPAIGTAHVSSAEKVGDGFEYQWVRFFCFGKEREVWLQPGVKVDAKGEMSLSAHKGKLNVSCKVEELTQYVADSSNYNQ